MKVSLICASYNRTKELEKLLSSLVLQSNKCFEFVLVDQNKKGKLSDLICQYSDTIDIKHIYVDNKGLSRARNIGVEHADGEILAFPDDDCWYDCDVLNLVVEYFLNNNCDLLSSGLYNEKSNLHNRFYSKKSIICNSNVLKVACSSTIFIKKNLYDLVLGFNDKLGLGSLYGSGEETDLIYKVLRNNCNAYYEPTIKIYHIENKFIRSFSSTITYGLGMGVVLRRYSPIRGIWLIFRALVGGVTFACTGSLNKSRIHFITFFSRFAGYFSYKDVYDDKNEN